MKLLPDGLVPVCLHCTRDMDDGHCCGIVAVPLFRDGTPSKFAFIDEADLPKVLWLRWHHGSNGYAMSLGTRVLLHHLIVGRPPEGQVTDHVNRDTLDNRRANLRFVTRSLNALNRAPRHKDGSYVGVSRHSTANVWRARVRVEGKQHQLGHFETEEDAAAAVAAWREEQFALSAESVRVP